jgi:hypothetical protein
MNRDTYFKIVKAEKKLLDNLANTMHVSLNYDGYSLIKKTDWNILYLDPKDFHEQIDNEIKTFFKEFFETDLYLLELPFPSNINLSEIELFKVLSYNDFIDLWAYYNDENFLKENYKEVQNYEGVLRSFFIGLNLGIFNDKLDWIFYNDVDYFFSAILYADGIKERIEKIFKDYDGLMTVEDIREDIPNFATKNWF